MNRNIEQNQHQITSLAASQWRRRGDSPHTSSAAGGGEPPTRQVPREEAPEAARHGPRQTARPHGQGKT